MARSFTVSFRSASIVGSLALAAILWLAVRPSEVQGQGARVDPGASLPSVTLRGRLTVEFAMDPMGGPATRDFAGPYQRVDEVTLTDEYVVLRKADTTGRGTLVLPRSRLVYINIGE